MKIVSDIIKVCKKHGELTKDQIHPKGKSKTGKQYYGCLLCKRIISKKFHTNNPESVKKSQHNYDQRKKDNPEWQQKRKVWMYNYQKRRRIILGDKLRAKEIEWKRTYYKKHREMLVEKYREMSINLDKSYVKSYLKRYYGFENPPNELVNAKAILMMLKREIMIINCNMGRNKYVAKTKKYRRRIQSEDAERNILNKAEENS